MTFGQNFQILNVRDSPTPVCDFLKIPIEKGENNHEETTRNNRGCVRGRRGKPRFYYSGTGLTSVKLPDGLKSIGAQTFRYCNSLTNELVIPASVTSIGNHAFRDCKKLKGELTLGGDLKAIGSARSTTATSFPAHWPFPTA